MDAVISVNNESARAARDTGGGAEFVRSNGDTARQTRASLAGRGLLRGQVRAEASQSRWSPEAAYRTTITVRLTSCPAHFTRAK